MKVNRKASLCRIILLCQTMVMVLGSIIFWEARAEQRRSTPLEPSIVIHQQSNRVTSDTWKDLVSGFSLNPLPVSVIQPIEKWLFEHPTFLDSVMARVPHYLPYVLQEVVARGLPTELALLPAIESAYDPHAVSHAQAVGMWQFIPRTGLRYGLKQNSWVDERRNIVNSTRAALDYLEFLHNDFDGDWHKALSAYNYGEDRLHRAEQRNANRGMSQALNKLRLPRETRRYVPQLLALANLIRNAHNNGLKLPASALSTIPDVVVLKGQHDLSRIAQYAKLSIEDFYRLNPAFKRQSSAPNQQHYLLLPTVNARHLTLAQRKHKLLVDDKPADTRTSSGSVNPSVATQTKHKVRYGETLSHIAIKYRIVTDDLAKWNNMKLSDPLLAGQLLTLSDP